MAPRPAVCARWLLAVPWLACNAEPSVEVTGAGESAAVDSTTAAGTSTDTGSSSSGQPLPPDVGADTTAAGSTGASPPLLDVGAPETGGVMPGCANGTDQVYVLFDRVTFSPAFEHVSEVYRLALDDLDALAFEHVFPLDCLGNDAGGNPKTAISIAIDHDGFAWVYDYDNLQKIDINGAAAACEVVPLSHVQIANPALFAFARLEPDDADSERLFVHEDIGQNLGGIPLPGTFGWLDLTLAPVAGNPIGMTPYIASSLVGTGDGRVFGMGTRDGDAGGGEIPEELVQYDPETGAILETYFTMETLMFPTFYAGDIFLIDRGTQDDTVPTNYLSGVWRLDLDDSDGNGQHDLEMLATDEIFPTTDGIIVPNGASSPTCIPVAPPG